MKKENYEPIRRQHEEAERRSSQMMAAAGYSAPSAMSLAAGGRMKQQIYADPYGFDAWDQAVSSRCFVTLADAMQWRETTGEAPPTRPPTAADYTEVGLPWFDYYAADLETVAGSPALALVKGVAEMAVEKGEQVLGPDGDVNPGTVVDLGPGSQPLSKPRPVREAKA